MDKWTVEMVETRLEDAAHVIRRLPAVRMPGYFNTWPSMLIEFADRIGREPERMRLPPPSSSAITRMEETLEWLRWLEGDDAKLVWARSEGTPWKEICFRFGVARATANRRYQYALALMAWRLNGRNLPSKRSRSLATNRVRNLHGLVETRNNSSADLSGMMARSLRQQGDAHNDEYRECSRCHRTAKRKPSVADWLIEKIADHRPQRTR
jgi:hypothetical protein